MVFLAYPANTTHDLLYERVSAVYNEVAQCTVNDENGIRVDDPGVTVQDIQDIFDLPGADGQSSDEQQFEVELLTKEQVRAYLRKQLTTATPDSAATAAATIQGFVGSKQAMLNAIDRIATLYGYDTGTNAGYLRAVYILVGIFT